MSLQNERFCGASEPRKVHKKWYSRCPKGWLIPAKSPSRRPCARSAKRPAWSTTAITKLGDIKYVYVRSWGDGERVFKIVSFYLLRYRFGRD